MMKEIFGLIISGIGMGLIATGIKNDFSWLAIIGFIAFFIGLRIAIGALIDRKIKKVENKEK